MTAGTRTSNQLGFALVFVVVNLHTLRHSLGPVYLTCYALVSGVVVETYFRRQKYRDLIDGGKSVAVWVAVAVAGAAVTLITTSSSGAITGISRFLFAMPVFLALVTFTDSRLELRSHISVMAGFYTLAAITVPLQELTGPIATFAEASTRGGFARYGSALGAISVVALAAGLVIPMIAESTLRFKWLFVTLIAGSALVSLSKAAIFAVLFGGAAYALCSRQTVTKRTATIVFALAIGIAGFSQSSTLQQRFDVIAQDYGVSASGEEISVFGAGAIEDAWSRLTVLPQNNYAALANFHTPFVYVIGGGYGMGGRTLVDSDDVRAPQGHNQYAELITVFGPALAAVLVGITIRVMRQLWRNYKHTGDSIYRTFLAVLGFLLIKGLFGGGVLFQPVAASVFWLSMFIAFSRTVRTT